MSREWINFKQLKLIASHSHASAVSRNCKYLAIIRGSQICVYTIIRPGTDFFIVNHCEFDVPEFPNRVLPFLRRIQFIQFDKRLCIVYPVSPTRLLACFVEPRPPRGCRTAKDVLVLNFGEYGGFHRRQPISLIWPSENAKEIQTFTVSLCVRQPIVQLFQHLAGILFSRWAFSHPCCIQRPIGSYLRNLI